MKERKEFWALNWLRFGLSIYIVLFHTLKEFYPSVYSNKWIYASLNLGNMATSVFFVLSGFLLTHVYITGKSDIALDKRKFWVSRFATLYPLHILTLLFALPAFLFMFHIHGAINVPIQPIGGETRPLAMWEIWLNVLMNITLTQAWNPLYLLLNGPSWSLSALFFFYAVFPFIAPRMNTLQRPAVMLFFLGIVFALPGIVAQLWFGSSVFIDGLLHRNPLIRLPLFLAGIVLAVINRRLRDENGVTVSPVPQWLLTVVILATVIAATYFQSMHRGENLHVVRNGLYYPAAIAIVWSLALPGATTNWNRKWSARLGKTALPIFLLHAPLYDIFERIERFSRAFITGIDTGAGFNSIVLMARTLDHKITLFPLYIFMVVYLASICQEKFIEPIQSYLKKKLISGKAKEGKKDLIAA